MAFAEVPSTTSSNRLDCGCGGKLYCVWALAPLRFSHRRVLRGCFYPDRTLAEPRMVSLALCVSIVNVFAVTLQRLAPALLRLTSMLLVRRIGLAGRTTRAFRMRMHLLCACCPCCWLHMLLKFVGFWNSPCRHCGATSRRLRGCTLRAVHPAK